ncbi:MAG TPA: hypothetical protein VGR91_00505 [Stellaceae bacterium]|nr:hypothetical protein [Stellaceae bacterium]
MSGTAMLSQPAHAAYRCWWAGPYRHCVYTHPGWRYYHRPWWWYRY